MGKDATNRRPLVGVSSNYIFAGSFGATGGVGSPRQDWCSVSTDYLKAIVQAGGIPVILPVFEDPSLAEPIITGLDALVLTGGGDIDPVYFGELPLRQLGEVCPQRDEADLWLARYALAEDLPLLAICRGIQVLAVAAGGSVYQDIAAQVSGVINHSLIRTTKWHAVHDVSLHAGSLAAKVSGGGLVRVNSFHHQAVKQVVSPLAVTGTAVDGVVEVIESKEHRFVLGVQWHPEMMTEHHPQAAALFRGLVAAAAG